MDQNRINEAKQNFDKYLQDGLITKGKNESAKSMYIQNADLSIKLASECMKSELNPHLWIIVMSYYSMFYVANAVLLELGYKTGSKIAHKVTNDALIVLVMDKLKKGMIDEYESAQEDAMEIASVKSEEIIDNFQLEMNKRSKFQYNMGEIVKEQKAKTSIRRAQEFFIEMKKLIREPLHKDAKERSS